MINRLTLITFILVVGESCRSVPKNFYKSEGLNFKISEDFKITETKTWKHNQATYINIEPRDKNLEAKISVTWLPKKFDLDKELQHFVESLKEDYTDDLQNAIVFAEVRSTKFGLNDSRQTDYVAANDGPKFGSYTSFYCGNNTVIVGQHYKSDTKAITNLCRQIIEETYTCVGQGNNK